MQKISELLNITVTEENSLTIYHPVFKDKLIYWETISGFWSKYEFDSNGNEIYYEDSDGDWEKREFDSNEKEIYFEDSDGDWIKHEYDLNNNEIYYENSNGTIEDNRVTELTIDQIAEKFGISVNQLKIKK